jgi:hypothetical protein
MTDKAKASGPDDGITSKLKAPGSRHGRSQTAPAPLGTEKKAEKQTEKKVKEELVRVVE